MIVYSSSARQFQAEVDENRIADRIEEAFVSCFGYRPGHSERQSWNNSMQFMERIVRKARIPDDCGILIEYNLPTTSRRIDFMITGQNSSHQDNFVVIELKQWEAAAATSRNGIVSTFTGGRQQEVTHPSYQAWSYMQFLTDMNSAIQDGSMKGSACAYLHNYALKQPEPLHSDQYLEIIEEAPLFFKEDHEALQQFIYKQVAKGKGINTMMLIEHGRLRPSRKLMDHVAGLFQGNNEFVLLDEQKVAYETIIERALNATRKTVIMIKGGPGTGKSVISMNAFGTLLQHGKNLKFVAPNQAFRQVMIEYLASGKVRTKARIRNLFTGSAVFWDTPLNAFDVLVVDEAHRLKKRGAYMYKGENQVEDVIRSARVTILFVDDAQQIRPDDCGSTAEIRRCARQHNAELIEMELSAQFRCSGAEGFINWLDDVLQIQHTANFDGWDQESFEFEIMPSPNDVYNWVQEKQSQGFKARMLAGYAWDWTKESENPRGEVKDVIIPEHDFALPWNQRLNSSLWAVLDEGVEQIGCIHTSQGLEFDYIGVIIGNDLKYDPTAGKVYADADSYKDKTGKKGISDDPEKLTQYIRNIYKTLLSRGMSGCYVYICDDYLREYMKTRLSFSTDDTNVLTETDEFLKVKEQTYIYETNSEKHLKIADKD